MKYIFTLLFLVQFVTAPTLYCSTLGTVVHQLVTPFSISPNPAHGSFTATFEQASILPTELRISNMLGQTVATSSIPSGVSEWRVMTDGLPAGMYVVWCGAGRGYGRSW